MSAIRVRLDRRSYTIQVTNSYAKLPAWLEALGLDRWGWVVSHRSLLDRYGRQVLGPLARAGWHLETITVPESELTKSYAMAERVLRQVARRSLMRTPVLLAFGGGVVGDLTGFVAAVFRRGIPYVQLPTTLLAQVDSAIGGKVGVDLPAAKNLVGAFYQPRLVVNHLGLLASLPPRQRRSGLAEIIKYAAIADPALFQFLESHVETCVRGSLRTDRVMVERCCRIKARLVSRDERDTTGLRAQLNFGHTLGHALEAATGYRRFTHGEAIAIGMAGAANLSASMGLMHAADALRLTRLLQRIGLPVRTSGVPLEAIRRALAHDKKFIHGRVRWVLPVRIGQVMVRDGLPTSLMWRAIHRVVT